MYIYIYIYIYIYYTKHQYHCQYMCIYIYVCIYHIKHHYMHIIVYNIYVCVCVQILYRHNIYNQLCTFMCVYACENVSVNTFFFPFKIQGIWFKHV